MKALRIALPWGLGVGILALLLLRVDADETAAALAGCDLSRYVPIACAFVFVWLAIDAHILAWLFSRVAAPLGFGQMLRLRARTYPAMVVSFDLANAWLVASVCRNTGARVSRGAGAMLVHYLADLVAVTGLAFGASWLVDAPIVAWLRPLLATLCLGFAAILLAGRLGRGVLRGRPVVETLGLLSLAQIARLVGSRALFQTSFVAFAWLVLPAFALDVSLADVAVRMPLVLGVAALPITPGGLGTTQAAITTLFAGLGPAPQLLAYGLVYGLTLIVLRLPLGLAAWLLPDRPAGLACMEGAA